MKIKYFSLKGGGGVQSEPPKTLYDRLHISTQNYT